MPEDGSGLEESGSAGEDADEHGDDHGNDQGERDDADQFFVHHDEGLLYDPDSGAFHEAPLVCFSLT